MPAQYVRKAVYLLSAVLPLILPRGERGKDGEKKIRNTHDFDGDPICLDSTRLNVLALSQVCVDCGLQGTYFAKEKHSHDAKRNDPRDRWAMNLYGVDALTGKDILICKQRVQQTAASGDSDVTMCIRCVESCVSRKR